MPLVSIRPRLVRWLSALIASLVSFQIGSTQYAFADSGCGLSDVHRYHAALQSETVEVTPAYRLVTARTFIKACPERWELRDAHLVAARGALDSGKPALAVYHYREARKSGAKLSPEILIDEATALDVVARPAESRAARNRAVFDWLSTLDKKALATLSVKRHGDGLIYTIAFNDTQADISAVWLAVPKGAGLPAAMIIRRDPQRSAWRSLRTPGETPDIRVAEFQTCRDRELVSETEGHISLDTLQTEAMRTLRAYLKKPHRIAPSKPGEPVESCLWIGDMLHVPGKN
jgi:hypothetical protein